MALNDEGSSRVLIGKICDRACEDGSMCTNGICSNGDVCLANTCSNGATCSGGLCGPNQICEPTRFGARCTADGDGDHCDHSKECRIDALYLGTRSKCMFSLNPREPYCRIPDGTHPDGSTKYKYRPSSWAECGSDGDDDECAGSDPTCYYCLGIPKACPDGLQCGLGGVKDGYALCKDGVTRCLLNYCLDGSVCGGPETAGPGLCKDGQRCDCVPATCPTGMGNCGDGGPGLCGGTAGIACFRPQTDRARWRFPTAGLISGNAILATCDADGEMYRDVTLDSPDIFPDRVPGLDPQPVGNDCLFIGGNDGYFYAFDEESLFPVGPTPTPGPGNLGSPPKGACLWRFGASGGIYSQPAAEPEPTATALGTADQRIFVGTGLESGKQLWRFRRSPVVVAAPCPAGDPYKCALTIGDQDVGNPINLGTQSKAHALVPRLTPTPGPSLSPGGECRPAPEVPARLLIGTQGDVGKANVRLYNLRPNPNPTPLSILTETGNRQFTRGLIQGCKTGIFYSGTGDQTSKSGLIAFALSNDVLEPWGEVHRGGPALTTPPLPNGCTNDDPANSVDFENAQWHRTTPVLNRDESFFFVGNRHAGGGGRSLAVCPGLPHRPARARP